MKCKYFVFIKMKAAVVLMFSKIWDLLLNLTKKEEEKKKLSLQKWNFRFWNVARMGWFKYGGQFFCYKCTQPRNKEFFILNFDHLSPKIHTNYVSSLQQSYLGHVTKVTCKKITKQWQQPRGKETSHLSTSISK